MRIGIVATSRSGSTFFRRYLCNEFGLQDSKSWLKHNLYKDIDTTDFAQKPHLLKILPHYVLEQSIYSDMPCIWLYRKDIVTQFLSHVTRLRTKVNHITSEEDRPSLEPNSLSATYEEFERFSLKIHEFWLLYKEHGIPSEEMLIAYEDFLKSADKICEKLNKQYSLKQNEKVNIKITKSLGIDYEKVFNNYEEIKTWFKSSA